MKIYSGYTIKSKFQRGLLQPEVGQRIIWGEFIRTLEPVECKDIGLRFQSLISFAHNIVLPFSENGLKTCEERNRKCIVWSAIQDYQKDIGRLEFELGKIL